MTTLDTPQVEPASETPEETGAERDMLRNWQLDVLRAEEYVRKTETAYESAKADAKFKKEAFDDAVRALRAVVRSNPQGTLFDTDEDEPDGDWRGATVDTLDIPDHIAGKLNEAEIFTIGNLADWTKDKQLIDIDGIGEKAAEQIESAMEKFWAERKDEIDDGDDDDDAAAATMSAYANATE